jgi:hypothetical protein
VREKKFALPVMLMPVKLRFYIFYQFFYTDIKGQLLFNTMPVGSLNINAIRCKVGHFLAD